MCDCTKGQEETPHLGLEIRRVERLMTKQRKYCAAHENADRLTGMHGYLIHYLYDHRETDVFQRDLERQFSISRSAVTVTLQLMEKNGLITRESVAQDARLKRIRLTEKALELHLQIEAEIAQFEAELTKDISAEDQAAFLRVTRQMRKNLGGETGCCCKGE